GVDARSALLGQPLESAISTLATHALDDDDLAILRSQRQIEGVLTPFPEQADEYFRSRILRVRGHLSLEESFGVLVVTEGTARHSSADSVISLARGDTVVVPFDAGRLSLDGDLTAIWARPPE